MEYKKNSQFKNKFSTKYVYRLLRSLDLFHCFVKENLMARTNEP